MTATAFGPADRPAHELGRSGRIRLALAALVAATLALALLALAGGSPSAQAAGSASFDWSMADRYPGTDENGDGRIDSFAPDGPLEVTPAGFRVNFVGSGAEACGASSTVWSIEGDTVTAGDQNVVAGDPRSCAFSYRFAEEGTYEVTLEGRDGDGKTVAEATNLVRVQDFLVVSLGDSVASGEGNPDVSPNPVVWQDEQCHRSAFAGPARAARALEAADPRTSVTFIHLACSGATIYKGLLGGYDGIIKGATLPPQVDALEKLIDGRELDAVLISIGANDVHFSNLVTRCFLRVACDQPGPGSAASAFEQHRQKLPGRYDDLASRLGALDLAAERVHLSEYFDPTRDGAGEPCPGATPGSIGILGDHPASSGGAGFEVTADEAAWASNVMTTSLNAEVASAASRHGWEYVGGIRSQFLTHGYCAADHWVLQWLESQADQGDDYGTLHPNLPGHNLYRDRLQARLTPSLYTGGNLQLPRRPGQRLEIQGRLSGSDGFLDVVDSVERGDAVTIRARVSGPKNAGQGIAFSLRGPGSLSAPAATTNGNGEATITYTAPDPIDADRARVVGTLVESGKTSRDTVGIRLEQIEVSIDPTSRTLAPGDQQQFTASVAGANDQSVTWSATGGTITQGGLYTAGQTPGTYSVTATSVEDPSKSADATVIVSQANQLEIQRISQAGITAQTQVGETSRGRCGEFASVSGGTPDNKRADISGVGPFGPTLSVQSSISASMDENDQGCPGGSASGEASGMVSANHAFSQAGATLASINVSWNLAASGSASGFLVVGATVTSGSRMDLSIKTGIPFTLTCQVQTSDPPPASASIVFQNLAGNVRTASGDGSSFSVLVSNQAQLVFRASHEAGLSFYNGPGFNVQSTASAALTCMRS